VTHRPAPTDWVPRSPCDARCLPVRGPAGALRSLRRGAALLAVAVAVAGTSPLLPLLPERARTRVLAAAVRLVLAAAGVRIDVVGPRGRLDGGRLDGGRLDGGWGDGGVLVVANHTSWVEVLVLWVVRPLRIVAKDEVRRWPVVGRAAACGGALFVDRLRLSTLPAAVADIAAALAAGHAVGVFPEGTTWCGGAAGPFRRAPFQAALDAGVPVRPVAVALSTPDGRPTRVASFVGDEDLLTCLARVLRLPGLVCTVTVLPTIPPAGDRAALAHRAGAAIGAVTGVAHAGVLRERVRSASR
jgi:1-acyl-sn-glycerol-3-phosphate acyltransferase